MSRFHPKPSETTLQFSPPEKISRRAFGRKAAGVAAISLSPTALLGQPPERFVKPPVGLKNTARLPTGGPASGAAGNVDTKLANIIRKYGDRLSEEQRERLRRILVYNEKMMDGIHTVPLQNGNPPSSVLKISFDKRNGEAKQQAALPQKKRADHRRARADGKGR